MESGRSARSAAGPPANPLIPPDTALLQVFTFSNFLLLLVRVSLYSSKLLSFPLPELFSRKHRYARSLSTHSPFQAMFLASPHLCSSKTTSLFTRLLLRTLLSPYSLCPSCQPPAPAAPSPFPWRLQAATSSRWLCTRSGTRWAWRTAASAAPSCTPGTWAAARTSRAPCSSRTTMSWACTCCTVSREQNRSLGTFGCWPRGKESEGKIVVLIEH